MEPVTDHSVIQSVFVRHRNALLLRGQFTALYTDYYLHLMHHHIRHAPELDQMLKDTLAMMALHLTARPWHETIAWTVNLRAPRLNLFVTGSSLQQSLTGRLFTHDVREPDRNFFYSQTTAPNLAEPRTSTVEVDGKDPVQWIQQFYHQSEQRPARAFRLPDEHFALVTAQPGCDTDWLESLDAHAVTQIESTEETSTLETRQFRFHCGCTLERILPVLGGWQHRLDDLFEGEDAIHIQCPRCGADYIVTREMLGESS
jgi:molecular chaperone Hsp33